MKKWLKTLFLVLLLGIGIFAFLKIADISFAPGEPVPAVEVKIAEDGKYDSKEDVALYIHTYWKSSKGNLRKVCEGCSIGGDIFTNVQEILPVKKGRIYYECDIDYEGGIRNSKRIVFSDDGLIFYTEDHYRSFVQLYGEEE